MQTHLWLESRAACRGTHLCPLPFLCQGHQVPPCQLLVALCQPVGSQLAGSLLIRLCKPWQHSQICFSKSGERWATSLRKEGPQAMPLHPLVLRERRLPYLQAEICLCLGLASYLAIDRQLDDCRLDLGRMLWRARGSGEKCAHLHNR